MSEDSHAEGKQKRGRGKGKPDTRDAFRLSTSYPDIIIYVYKVIAPRHQGKGKWKATAAGNKLLRAHGS
jgi:hypothetical protein